DQFKQAGLVSKDKIPANVYIAPGEPVDQDTLLQGPQDATRYYFLPIFKIREEPQHIFVQFAAVPGTPGWRLDVKLVEDKSPDLRPPPLTYTIGIEPQPARVYLSYNTNYGTARQLDFENCQHEIIDNKPGYSLSMNVS